MAVRLPQVASSTAAARRIPSIVRRGDDSATGVSGSTGHRARSPAGFAMIPDRKPDAAALGRPGRTDTVMSRTDRPRTNPCGVVGDQLLADELLDPVAGLRSRKGVVVDVPHGADGGIAAEHGKRAGEDHQRWHHLSAAVLEHGARPVDVGVHAQVEVRLGGAADHPRQVEDGIDLAQLVQRRAQLTRHGPHAAVGANVGRRRDQVDQDQLGHGRLRGTAEATGSPRSRRASSVPRKPVPPVTTMRVLIGGAGMSPQT
jgi:hypothetical protein